MARILRSAEDAKKQLSDHPCPHRRGIPRPAGTEPSSCCCPNVWTDFVGEDNPVRVVDAFIEELDLAVLGFAGVGTKSRMLSTNRSR